MSTTKQILILGSGYISGCLLHFFIKLKRSSPSTSRVRITLASNVAKELEELGSSFPGIQTVALDVEKEEEGESGLLFSLISSSHLVISLLPNNMHFPIAKACIRSQVPLLHASYITPEVEELNEAAEKAGVLILGELGLDPGIDHLLAMKCIDEIHADKGRVLSFSSYCGGLPCQDESSSSSSSSNPLKYKFSWSPSTALGNVLNGARYLKDRKIVEIPGGGSILDATRNVPFLPEYRLESHPNRDSLVYLEKYKIPYVKGLYRGTLRYQGFGEVMKILVRLGMLSKEPLGILDPSSDSPPLSWREFTTHLLKRGREGGKFKELKDTLPQSELLALERLGLCSDALVDKLGSPFATLCKQLERGLQYSKGEQDVVIIHHEIEAKYSGSGLGSTSREKREVDFIVHGDPVGEGYSAMAKTVSYTLGIAAEMILNSEIRMSGVRLPLRKEIYDTVLERLMDYGMFAIERISTL